MAKLKEQDIDDSEYIDESTAPTTSTDTFEFDEKAHVYKLNGKRMYGITSVLGVIAKPALIPWAAKQVVEWIANNCPKDKVGGLVYYAVNNKHLEEAKNAHRLKKESAGDVGTIVHKLVEDFANGNLGFMPSEHGVGIPETVDDLKKIKEPTEAITMVITMFNNFLQWATKNDVKFIASERRMYSKKYWIAGTVDAVVEIKGKRYVVDIKTYSGIYDRTPFLQMAGYAIMLEEMGEKIDGTIIVRLGKDGSFDVHKNTNLLEEKQGFLAALTLFKTLEQYKPKKKY